MRQNNIPRVSLAVNPLRLCLLFASVVFLLSACKKEKFDYAYDDRVITHAAKSSGIRLVNLGTRNQVIANEDDSLTSFIVRDPNGPLSEMYPPTPYFMNGGRLGKTWTVPQDLFDKDNKLRLTLSTVVYQGIQDPEVVLNLEDNDQQPMDYYLTSTFTVDGMPEVLPVPRGVTAPSRPDHFKVRIINLTGRITNLADNASGVQEHLDGPITLAYADGTEVSDRTTKINTTKRVSDYIELPYGTYQFRILSDDGRQLPGAISSSIDPYDTRYMDPPTSTMAFGMLATQTTHLVFAPIQQYLPGGIYTIVVTPRDFRFFTSATHESVGMKQNAFEVIADNSPSANITYCRMQGVNAFHAQPVTIRANNLTLPGQLNFGQSGDYQPLVHGQYTVEALDASGNVLATASELLRAGQNYTAWLYPDAAGNAKLVLVFNDLSGTYYKNPDLNYANVAVDDGSFGRFLFRFPFNKRFLNLSPDNPYITFTRNNGQSISGKTTDGAEMNLIPGVPVTTEPYLASDGQVDPFHFMAYRSAPDVVPGTWADDIPLLGHDHFIARKVLYQQVNRNLPVQEPGIYTVALIGRSGNNVPAALKARMMVVKHNK